MINKRLSEIVIRTPNMQKMLAFYRDVIELEPSMELGSMRFLRISETFKGHTPTLGLFELDEISDADDSTYDGHDARKSPVHHIAFTVDLNDYHTEFDRITALGYKLRTMEHSATQVRSFYLNDPDGNTVEFACFDPSIPNTDLLTRRTN
jgi:catechol 2,3-dioxygenase-like lactoylglutathione lyase family enzyme